MPDYAKPLPVPSVESKPYWDALREHRLMLPRCDDCGRCWFPPSTICPNCNSESFTWSEASGRGKVFSFVVYHRVYHPGFAGEVPYTVALVELEEGPRLITNLIGIPPETVVCDMKVRVVFDDITESITLAKFTPAEPLR